MAIWLLHTLQENMCANVFWKCFPKALRDEVLQSPFMAHTFPEVTRQLLSGNLEWVWLQDNTADGSEITFQIRSHILGQDYKV